ncbi:MAG TPA: DUF354 domain-containing protein [Candidatus Paceibacterota bacterium]|nr:DUF354 domain-containing protein [Candidatus Paceibacterota bacterium]
MALRRWDVTRKRAACKDVWPIKPGSEKAPAGWHGWPDGKQFALVLTHDVEGSDGLAKIRPLIELERSLGFRSCFNLIPEGSYKVSPELRNEILAAGCEIGVHDLYHDGRLFLSRGEFVRRAPRINHYIREWGVAGFRSGFMLRNLEWLHDLELEYDASTFDTDPFEPQPIGQNNIFPFWVPNPNFDPDLTPPLSHAPSGRGQGEEASSVRGNPASIPSPTDLPSQTPDHRHTDVPTHRHAGYVELPYTLPQDSTLFLLLREPNPDIWLRKLDWVAEHGGMALVNVHPDYMRFDGERESSTTYPASHYRQLLQYAVAKYGSKMWNPLPREVASVVPRPRLEVRPSKGASKKPVLCPKKPNRTRGKIWIDLDNTPHVPFFEPIIEELERRGYSMLLTMRDAFGVIELAKMRGLPCRRVGRHYGKHRLAKGYGLVFRAMQLAPLALRERPILAVSHGARSQLIACNLLRIPSLLIEDYEFARFPWLTRPQWVLAPDAIPKDALPQKLERVRTYHGLKEDVYVWKLKPDRRLLADLGIPNGDIVITVRPPATEAHYHNPESEALFNRFMERACALAGACVVLLPRNKAQAQALRAAHPDWFRNGHVKIPDRALDGLNLLSFSDLVVSGGGTMNREAAALGVPVYSIFRGRTGAVDHQLSREGRLIMLTTVQDVEAQIRIEKRLPRPAPSAEDRHTLFQVVDTIAEIADSCIR